MNARPFTFETEFDASGAVLRASSFTPVKRAYSPAEVEALVAEARLDARTQALAEVEALQAQALSAIAQTVTASVPGLAQLAQAHREQAADLALAMARALSGAALEKLPTGPLHSALEALGQEIEASPRLVIRAGSLNPDAAARLEQACADAGFKGLVTFRDEPGLPPAAFQLEWADGRAAFDPEEAAGRMAEALSFALAAEAGHAETLNQGRAD